MKKILIFFLIFCFQIGNAEVGDVYYCIEKYVRGIENFTDGPIEKNYITKKFSFKREENRIVFNKNADNSWNNFIMYHVMDYQADVLKETFAAWDEKENPGAILRYKDGEFMYSSNWGVTLATYTFAECSTY